MDIATKTVTTKIHTAVATPEILTAVAIQAVKNQLALKDDVIVSSSAKVAGDGSITVELVEAVADAPAPAPDPVAQAEPAPVSPVPLTGLATL